MVSAFLASRVSRLTATAARHPAAEPQPRAILALFCADRGQLERLRAALPPGLSVVAADQWRAFERAAGLAACCVVVLPSLRDTHAIDQLIALRDRLPLLPLVLVTEKDAENLRLLRHLEVEEIVWTHEAPRELAAAVGRARGSSLLRQMAAAIDRAEQIPPKLRQALAFALRSERPIPSVIELAAAVGCDRRTIWRYWREAFGPDHPLLPGHFLDWLLLLRAASLKAPGRKWTAVAQELGIHEHTIARLAKRLAGLSLRELASGGQPLVARLFARRVLSPLLTASR